MNEKMETSSTDFSIGVMDSLSQPAYEESVVDDEDVEDVVEVGELEAPVGQELELATGVEKRRHSSCRPGQGC
jgi:hypothetical protein